MGIDARKYAGGNWFDTSEIKEKGSGTFEVAEVREFSGDKGPRLVLVNTDGHSWELNTTNNRTMIAAHGHDADGWVGLSIELVWDPEVLYKGKRSGGVRIKAEPRKTSAKSRR